MLLAAQEGKAIFCTKPLARSAAEAQEMLEAVEKALAQREEEIDLLKKAKQFFAKNRR